MRKILLLNKLVSPFSKLEDALYEGRMKFVQVVLEKKILMFVYNFVFKSIRTILNSYNIRLLVEIGPAVPSGPVDRHIYA